MLTSVDAAIDLAQDLPTTHACLHEGMQTFVCRLGVDRRFVAQVNFIVVART